MKIGANLWKHVRRNNIAQAAFAVIAVLLLIGAMLVIQRRGAITGEKPFVFYDTNQIKDLPPSFLVVTAKDPENGTQVIPCFAPLAYNRGKPVPVFVDDGTPPPPRVGKYPEPEVVHISDLGKNPSEASVSLARRYWERVDMAIVVDNYENAVRASSISALACAPILYDSAETREYLSDMGIKSVIAVGDVTLPGMAVHHIQNNTDEWEFIANHWPETCRDAYLVVTNPRDTLDSSKPGVEFFIPHLSAAGSLLAAWRTAFVAVGNYTVNLSHVQGLGYGTGDAGSGERGGDPDTIPDDLELHYQMEIDTKSVLIDNTIDLWASFIKDRSGTPHYVALAGGPAAVPMLYIKSPIWYENVQQSEKGEEYLATDMYYGDLDIHLSATNDTLENNFNETSDPLYTLELSVGRIIGTSLPDAVALCDRSIFYYEYERPAMAEGWGLAGERKAEIITSLMTGDSDSGASRHQQAVLGGYGVIADIEHPYECWKIVYFNEAGAVRKMEDMDIIIYDGHGYPDGWYWLWASTHDNSKDYDRIGSEDIYGLTLKATPVFGACCLSSALDWPIVWNGSENQQTMAPATCISLAFIHAGAGGYIGATEESWGAFFGGLADGTPDAWGYGDFDMPTMFWDHVLGENKTTGDALRMAKDDFYNKEWTDQSSRPFARVCVLETQLYGDPAAPFSL